MGFFSTERRKNSGGQFLIYWECPNQLGIFDGNRAYG